MSLGHGSMDFEQRFRRISCPQALLQGCVSAQASATVMLHRRSARDRERGARGCSSLGLRARTACRGAVACSLLFRRARALLPADCPMGSDTSCVQQPSSHPHGCHPQIVRVPMVLWPVARREATMRTLVPIAFITGSPPHLFDAKGRARLALLSYLDAAPATLGT